MRKDILHCIFLLGLFWPALACSQIILSEVSSSGSWLDEDNDGVDWIEIRNEGNDPVDLTGYLLNDDDQLQGAWTIPFSNLDPGERVLFLASGKDRPYLPENWQCPALESDNWRYIVPNSAVPTNWNSVDFNASIWDVAPGGFGYGDGDDQTILNNASSVFLRRNFFITDPADWGYLSVAIDYDDGFIAYLNGTEIGRSPSMNNVAGNYNDVATTYVEALLYNGGQPLQSTWTAQDIEELLVPGENVFAVQVHNNSANSSDLTIRPFLGLTRKDGTDTFWPAPPEWWPEFEYHMHTSFAISSSETVYLISPSGETLDQLPMLEGLPTGYSIGRAEGTSAGLCIFENETPDAANDDGPCVSGILAAPALTTPSGWYDAPLTVQVAFPNANQTVRYTTNGDVPTEASPAFPASGITTNESTVLSVRAYSNDGSELPSPVKDATFIVDEFAPILPTFSIITDYDNLWDWNTGIYVMGPNASEEYPHFGSNFWEPWSKLSRMQFFDANGVLQSEDKMDLEIHGGWSRAEPQRSFRLDFKNEYSGDFEWPIFSDKPWLNSFNNINLRNGGQHSWATKMQDGVIARLALNTHNMASSWEPSHVYLNGEYWGLYAAREKLDEHYIADNFGTESESVDLIGPFAVLNGSDADLQASANLMMSTPTGNSNFVSLFSERFDIENYMDYFIFETYAQNTDWMGIAWGLNNVKAFRPSPEEKWHYILYDTDAGFGFFGASVWDNFIQLARNPGYPNLHSDLFDRMLDNTEFRLRFINRYADLVNTLFQTNSFNDQVTEAMDAITSSMPYHIYRWNSPGSLTNWLNALNTLTQHNTNRIGTSRNHLMSSFGLPEDYECTLDVFPPLAGTVRVNTITPGPLPWDGVYFKDCPIEIEAYAEPGWMFDQWDMNAHIQSGAMNATDHANVISLHSNDLYRARFEPCPTDASVDLVLSGTLLQAETTGIPFIDSIEWSMNGEVLGSGMEWLPEWDGQYFASVYFDGCLVESGGFWTNGVDIADQVKEAPAATLYPNPANDHVLLTSFDRESDVKVFNAMGQWIWGGAALTARVQGTRGERIWDVDTSKWPEGTYFVHFGPLQVEKLIVHR